MGRAFLRRIIDLSTLVKQPNHFLRLSAPARSDIEWWHQFCGTWNGTSMMFEASQDVMLPSFLMAQDHGVVGRYFNQNWFQIRWAGLGSIGEQNITVKELLPIVLAAAVWGPQWAGKTVQAHCDNMAVVPIFKAQSSRNAEAMDLYAAWPSWRLGTRLYICYPYPWGLQCAS